MKILTKLVSSVCAAVMATSCMAMPVGAAPRDDEPGSYAPDSYAPGSYALAPGSYALAPGAYALAHWFGSYVPGSYGPVFEPMPGMRLINPSDSLAMDVLDNAVDAVAVRLGNIAGHQDRARELAVRAQRLASVGSWEECANLANEIEALIDVFSADFYLFQDEEWFVNLTDSLQDVLNALRSHNLTTAMNGAGRAVGVLSDFANNVDKYIEYGRNRVVAGDLWIDLLAAKLGKDKKISDPTPIPIPTPTPAPADVDPTKYDEDYAIAEQLAEIGMSNEEIADAEEAQEGQAKELAAVVQEGLYPNLANNAPANAKNDESYAVGAQLEEVGMSAEEVANVEVAEAGLAKVAAKEVQLEKISGSDNKAPESKDNSGENGLVVVNAIK